MDYIKHLFFAFFVLGSYKSYSQNFLPFSHRKNLPELSTKQSIDSLRFISNNGKFTYYQRNNGQLNLSTNYKITPVLKKKPGTNFLVSSTSYKKRIIIEVDESYNSFYGVRKLKNIFISKYGSSDIKKIGDGISAKLHVEDKWISYYNPHLKKLYFYNLEFSTFKFEIQLPQNNNSYFIPQVIMPNDGALYFSSLTSKGVPQISIFDRKTNKTKIVFTGSSHQFKIELCMIKHSLIIGEFNLYRDKSLNMISVMSKGEKDFSKRNIIYESPGKDIGNMVCDKDDENIYFIKNYNRKSDSEINYEAIQLNIASKKVKRLSNVKYATQIVNMDGRLLLPYRGKFYLLLGENNLATIDLLNNPKVEK